MLGVMYDVVARYKVDTTSTNAPLDAVSGRAERATSALGGVAGALAAISGTAALGVLGSVAQKLVELNSEAVEAKIGVASILTLNGLSTFEQSMGRAQRLTERLRKAAKETKGETGDLINIVSTSLPGFASINPSDDDIVKFAQRATAASNVLLGSDYDLGGQQLLQIFGGQAGSDNRLFQAIRKPLMEQLGIKSQGSKAVEDFNKLATKDPKKIFDGLMTVLASFDEANKLLNETVGGQVNALGDNANMVLMKVGDPLTKLVSERLKSVNDWFEKNEELVNRVAASIGNKLTGALDAFGKAAMFAARNVDVLLASSAGLLAMRQLGSQAVMSALVNWPSTLIGGGRAAIGRAGASVTGKVAGLNLGARASALGSFIAPMALRSSDSWMMGTGAQRASLAARFGMWRAGDAARRGIGGAAGRIGEVFAPAALRASDNWMMGTGAQRAALAGRFGMWRASDAATRGISGALGLTGITSSSGWAYRTGIQRAALVTGTAGRSVASGLAGGVSNLFGAVGASGLVKGLTALLRVAGPVGLAIGAVVGVMQVLQDKTNSASATFFDMVNLLFVELDKLAGAFGFGAASGGAAGAVRSFTQMLGEGLTNVLSFVTWTVAKLVEGLNFLAYIIEGIAGGLGVLYRQYEEGGGGMAGLRSLDPSAAFGEGFKSADERQAKRAADAAFLEKKRADEERRKRLEEEDKKTGGDVKPPPVINIKIEQRIETDANPERIAYSTASLLNDVFTNGRISTDRFTE